MHLATALSLYREACRPDPRPCDGSPSITRYARALTLDPRDHEAYERLAAEGYASDHGLREPTVYRLMYAPRSYDGRVECVALVYSIMKGEFGEDEWESRLPQLLERVVAAPGWTPVQQQQIRSLTLRELQQAHLATLKSNVEHARRRIHDVADTHKRRFLADVTRCMVRDARRLERRLNHPPPRRRDVRSPARRISRRTRPRAHSRASTSRSGNRGEPSQGGDDPPSPSGDDSERPRRQRHARDHELAALLQGVDDANWIIAHAGDDDAHDARVALDTINQALGFVLRGVR
jgi:hypothetical protein